MKYEQTPDYIIQQGDKYRFWSRLAMAILAVALSLGLQLVLIFLVGTQGMHGLWMLVGHGLAAAGLLALATFQMRNAGGLRALVGHGRQARAQDIPLGHSRDLSGRYRCGSRYRCRARTLHGDIPHRSFFAPDVALPSDAGDIPARQRGVVVPAFPDPTFPACAPQLANRSGNLHRRAVCCIAHSVSTLDHLRYPSGHWRGARHCTPQNGRGGGADRHALLS
ncbi:hypothetical protein ACVW0A_005710 [Pseudomonas sp. TE3610]